MIVSSTYIEDMRLARWVFHAVEFTVASLAYLLLAYYNTVAVYSWSIANNFVIDVYCRCLEILCQIALSSIANYFRSYSLLQFGIKSIGINNKVITLQTQTL